MSDIVISKNDEVDIIVKSNDSGIIMELSEFFTFYVPGYKFVPSYRNKLWDGKIRLYDTRNYTLPSGLLYHLEKFADERGYVIGRGEDATPIERRIDDCSIPELTLCSDNNIINLRDYQTSAIEHALKFKRALLVSPTGSGKSLMIYMILRWYLEASNKNALIVVPTTSLVEQLWKDFGDYSSKDDSFDPNEVHRIYAGKEKESFEQRVVITTWQSVFKMPRNWFEDFEMVVGDEAHLFKAKSLTTIMGHLRNAWLRIGTTGTLDGTKVHKLVLEGAFGPVLNVTSTKKLIESDTLSELSIDVLHMQYPDAEKKAFGKKTYQEEVQYIVAHEKRNNFIKNLALAQKGNTLVLFNLVEKHGKPLYNLIRDAAKIDRKVFYVSGEVGALDREEIRTLVEKEKDAIIVASLGTFSTGINIKNLHNMVFAAPTKSQVRVLQSIGRSLRKSETGQPAKVYDLCDDFSWKKRKNYTLGHGIERIGIYEKEELDFKTYPVPMS
jgi:superfamily II DNA or RNA helicase